MACACRCLTCVSTCCFYLSNAESTRAAYLKMLMTRNLLRACCLILASALYACISSGSPVEFSLVLTMYGPSSVSTVKPARKGQAMLSNNTSRMLVQPTEQKAEATLSQVETGQAAAATFDFVSWNTCLLTSCIHC